MKILKWIFLFQIIAFYSNNSIFSQTSDTNCRVPSFLEWKNSLLDKLDSLTYEKFNKKKHLATGFPIVEEAMEVLIYPDELDKVFCKVFQIVSDSIDWDYCTIVFHYMERRDPTRVYITIAFSDHSKTLGRYYNTFDKSYHQFESTGFFIPDNQREVLSSLMYSSNGFLVISRFDINLKPYFTKLLVGPSYQDIEPLLRVYYSE